MIYSDLTTAARRVLDVAEPYLESAERSNEQQKEYEASFEHETLRDDEGKGTCLDDARL